MHGTHRSLVDSNVLWDTAAAGIYIEDGNEMFNTLSLLLAFTAIYIKLIMLRTYMYIYLETICICLDDVNLYRLHIMTPFGHEVRTW